jgi:methylmalonyl-CoA mutase C-terminal domain/subunit
VEVPPLVAQFHGRRAIVAKLGFDAHWRGAIVVAQAFRNAGMEVIYLGHVTADQAVAAVIEEDVDLIGFSCLSGNHIAEMEAFSSALRGAGREDDLVVMGGAIPQEDYEHLHELGVAAIFPTGSLLDDTLSRIAELFTDAEREEATL